MFKEINRLYDDDLNKKEIIDTHITPSYAVSCSVRNDRSTELSGRAMFFIFVLILFLLYVAKTQMDIIITESCRCVHKVHVNKVFFVTVFGVILLISCIRQYGISHIRAYISQIHELVRSWKFMYTHKE